MMNERLGASMLLAVVAAALGVAFYLGLVAAIIYLIFG